MPTRFLWFAAFIVSSFVWNQWQRKASRQSRVFGVLGLFVVLILLPWIFERFR